MRGRAVRPDGYSKLQRWFAEAQRTHAISNGETSKLKRTTEFQPYLENAGVFVKTVYRQSLSSKSSKGDNWGIRKCFWKFFR